MKRSIRAAVFTETSGRFCEIKDVLLESPDDNELVIKVKACGICHTDIGISEYQERPAVLGHETAGAVVEIGANVTDFKVGDRVVATFSSCGACDSCCDKNPAYCIDHIGRNFDGLRPNGEGGIKDVNGEPIYSAFFQQSGFATHAIVQADNVVKIPDGLSYELAAPLGCGIQTGVGAILRSMPVKKQNSVVIFGVGAVGLSAVMAANIVGCYPIIAVDIETDRLQMAKQFGAHHLLSGDHSNLVEEIKNLTDGGAHFSLEGTGVENIFHVAVNCLRPGGTCGTLAYPGVFGEPVKHPGGFAFMNTRQIGIIEGDSYPEAFIPELAQMQMSGRLPYEKLIETFSFENINEALKACDQKTVIKPVLVFD